MNIITCSKYICEKYNNMQDTGIKVYFRGSQIGWFSTRALGYHNLNRGCLEIISNTFFKKKLFHVKYNDASNNIKPIMFHII